MRLHQENKLAAVSSKTDPQRALAFYKQVLDLNTKLVSEILLRDNADRLSSSMQRYYFERLAELASRSNR